MPPEASTTKGKPPPYSDELRDAQHALNSAAQLGESSRAGKLEQEFVESVNTASQAPSSSDGLSTLLHGVNSLVDSLPPLVRALDAIAQVHPFLSIAVGAFKVVIELEVKRRDNDKKVNLLFLEMRDMMAALLQLQGVRAGHVGRDGLSVGARLDDLVRKTAEDIKGCANACDAYARKRLLVKVLKAPGWDATLREYVQLFADRKAQFGFAIAVHTGLAVDRANDKLDALVEKMDVVLEFFERTAPREQRALAEAVRQEGGPHAVLNKADVLKELLLKEQQLEGAALPPPGERRTAGAYYPGNPVGPRPAMYYFSRAAETRRARRTPGREGYGYRPGQRTGGYYPTARGGGEAYMYPTEGRARPHSRNGWPGDGERVMEEGEAGKEEDGEVERLMRDLADEPAVAIRRNFVSFERKFRIQQRELVEEMTRVVVHEGDRVIGAVLAGPHERIIDPDMYEIWKDMRWRGIVKARHLVLAIHDYYIQRLDDQQRALAQGAPPQQRPIAEADVWALEYLDLMRLQRIVEALDGDMSGFITVQEVNYFTTSRPRGWSLLHWLAYWAVGWQVSMTEYKRKIHALLARMAELQPLVRARGAEVGAYVAEAGSVVREMTGAFREDVEDDSRRPLLLERFGAYVEQEEARLRAGLETARYDLDALDTLALINGPRGLERNVYVILYLLLRRHYEVMRVARKAIVHPQELSDAVAAIRLVKDALDYRKQEVTALFTQRRLFVSLEMPDFACGMLLPSYGGYAPEYNPDALIEAGEGAEPEEIADPPETILKYPPHLEDFYPESDDGVREEGTDVSEELRPLLGRWAGVRSSEAIHSTFAFVFHAMPNEPNRVIAVPLLSRPWLSTRSTVTGKFSGVGEDGRRIYVLKESHNNSTLSNAYLRVALSEDGSTLFGEEHTTLSLTTPGPKPHIVIKKDLTPEIMVFYPAPVALAENRAAALWRFATSAVLYDVRRRRFSWGFIAERRDRRRLLASLLLAEARNGFLHPDDVAEQARLANATVPADMYYCAYASVEPERVPWLLPWCAECKRVLRADVPCVRCVDCDSERNAREARGGVTVLCGREECADEHQLWGDHRLVKTRDAGWMLERFERETGIGADKLGELSDRAARAVRASRRFDTGAGVDLDGDGRSSTGSLVSPQSLSTIAERTESEPTGENPHDLAVGESFAVSNGGLREPATRSPEEATSRDRPAPGSVSFGFPGSPHQERNVLSMATPAEEQTPLADPPVPTCVSCQLELTFPFWVCVECVAPTYICQDCGGRLGGISRGAHEPRHVLLRVPIAQSRSRSRSGGLRRGRAWSPDPLVPPPMPPPLPPALSVDAGANEVRMSGMEERLGDIESRCGRIEQGMENIEARLVGEGDRLERVESMLEAVLSLLRER